MEIYGVMFLLASSFALAMIRLIRCERNAMGLLGKREHRVIMIRAHVRAKNLRKPDSRLKAGQDPSPPIIWATKTGNDDT